MKRLIAVIASLSLAAMLASCGTAEDPSSTAKKTASSKAEQTTEDASSQAEKEPQAEPEEPDPSEESQELEESETETDVTVDFADVTFTNTAGEEVTYDDVASIGQACTTEDGLTYCFVSDGAGAGSVYYKVFYTEDGQEWKESETPLKVNNGENDFWSCEDGTIVGFEFRTAENRAYPKAVVYSFDKDTHSVSAQEYTDVFNSVTDAAGNPLTDPSTYDFTVVSSFPGREFECQFYDLDGNLLADDIFAIQ